MKYKTTFSIASLITMTLFSPINASEFRVNNTIQNSQMAPAIASDGDTYMIVWHTLGQDGSGWAVYGRNVDKTGNPISMEFQINSYTTETQSYATIASNGTNYLATWRSYGQDGDASGIYGRLISSTGSPIGSDIQINTHTTGNQDYPVVSSIGSNYVVAWRSENQDMSGTGVFSQKVSSDGTLIDTEVKVNSYTQNDQRYPEINSNGEDYLIAWDSEFQDGSDYGLFAQKYDSDGSVSSEIPINMHTQNGQQRAAIASDGDNYLITWESNEQDDDGYGVYARLFDANANPISDEFLVNTQVTHYQDDPDIASNGVDYLIVWEGGGDNLNSYGIFAQLVDSQGNKIGNEFLVNSYTTGDQIDAAVASNGQEYLITWSSNVQDGDEWGVYCSDADKQIKTAYLLRAEDIFGELWDVSELDSLYNLFIQGQIDSSILIDGETWYLGDLDYSENNFWGDILEFGEARIDAYGYKHINFGFSLSTYDGESDIIPEPITIMLFALGIVLKCIFRKK